MTKKLTPTQCNDNFMRMMRDKGFDTIFTKELPFPSSTRNCSLILARHGLLIYIRSEV